MYREKESGRPLSLLDFGCGSGKHRRRVEECGYTYTGVDLVDTTGFNSTRTDDAIITYEGEALPFKDASFDVVYSSQVFEHVLDPYASMRECRRVLKPRGAFIGSVSFLEPYHAHQTFSYTPYGFNVVANACGLKMVGVSPGADGLSWLIRKLLILSGNDKDDAKDASIESIMEKAFSSLNEKQKTVVLLNTCATFAFYFVADRTQR